MGWGARALAPLLCLAVGSPLFARIPPTAATLADEPHKSFARIPPTAAMLADESHKSFAIVVDAGSSGSRVHVFTMVWGGGAVPGVQLPSQKLKVEPGLSSFEDEPSEAGGSMKDLVEFAMNAVPANKHDVTPFVIAGTAGLRLLSDDLASSILKNCEEYVSAHSDFRVQSSVISGMDEGVFGWLSINFLAKRLKGMAHEKEGTLLAAEVGGASFQLTFFHDGGGRGGEPPFTAVELGGVSYSLYSHSYLGLGQDEARHNYNTNLGTETQDPCLQKGYTLQNPPTHPPHYHPDVYLGKPVGEVRGGGDFEECRLRVRNVLLGRGEAVCNKEPCAMRGVHQPRFWEGGGAAGEIIAFEHFRHTANALGMVPRDPQPEVQALAGVGGGDSVAIDEYEAAAKRVCNMEWGDVAGGVWFPSMRPNQAQKYCFSATFLSVLLQEGLGLPRGTRMRVLSQIASTDLDWALGMALTSASRPNHTPTHPRKVFWVTLPPPPHGLSLLLTLGGLVIVLALLQSHVRMRAHPLPLPQFFPGKRRFLPPDSLCSPKISQPRPTQPPSFPPSRRALDPAPQYAAPQTYAFSSSPRGLPQSAMTDDTTVVDSPRRGTLSLSVCDGLSPTPNSRASWAFEGETQFDGPIRPGVAGGSLLRRKNSEPDIGRGSEPGTPLLITPSSSFRNVPNS